MEPLLKREDAAKALAVSLTKIKDEIRAGRIRVIRIGGAVRIEPAEIRRYIDSRRRGNGVGEFVGTEAGRAGAGPVAEKTQAQDSHVTIYHGDCREILQGLGPVDIVLTDPPYGLSGRMTGGTWGAAAKYAALRGWDELAADVVLGLPGLAPAVIVWGGNNYSLPPTRSWLVWDKQNAVPTMADCELAWTSLRGPAKRFSGPVGRHTWNHPTQKPAALMRWCLSFASGAAVLDPFMGSGTTLVAAKQLNRKAVGIEIEERYCEIAVRRLAQSVIEFPDPATAPPEQITHPDLIPQEERMDAMRRHIAERAVEVEP